MIKNLPDCADSAQDARTWVDRVQYFEGAVANEVTLNHLRSLEREISHDADRRGGETIDHAKALTVLCAYKNKVTRLMYAA